jgi:YVTN family beta-propeller protein
MKGRLTNAVVALGVAASFALAPPPVPAVAVGGGGTGELHPVAPATLLDTRSGSPVGPGGTVQVQVTGRGGVPAGDVLAVALDVTATDGSAATSVTAYATGATQPRNGVVYAAADETATAGTVVPVGTGGRVTLANAAGDVHLVVSVTGWYGAAAAPAGLRFHAFAPQPAVDTRTTGTPLGPGETRNMDVPWPLVPAYYGGALLLRVTVPNPTQTTHLTVWQAGTPRPATANVSAPFGRVSSALVTVPLPVAVHNETGNAHVVVHVVGWADNAAARDDGRYQPLPVPATLADTRNGTEAPVAPLGTGGTLSVQVAGRGGVPYGATAALLTVAAVRPAATGTLSVLPDGSASSGAQQVGYVPDRPAASLVVAKLGRGGRVTIRASAGPVDVAVDVHGWYTGAADYVPLPGQPTAGGVVVDAASRYAYASNQATDSVDVVDLSSGTAVDTIAVGTDPGGLDLTPDGATLYVVNAASHDISVVDVATRHELRRITLPAIYHPTEIAIGAHGFALVYLRRDYSEGGVARLRLADDLVYAATTAYTAGEGSLAASADREYIAIGYSGATPGDLIVYEAATDLVRVPGKFLSWGAKRVAASSDGTLLAGPPYLVDRVTGEVRDLPSSGSPYPCAGAAFAPDDEVVYQSCLGRVTIRATADLADRGSVPRTGRVDDDYWHDAGVAVATPDGSRVLVVTTGGLALVPVGAPYA